jgi:enoyl-CoA hydratase
METLIYSEARPGIGVVTLNRPRRANAMNKQMLGELKALCSELSKDSSLRCVVVTGAGPAFCAGFDLKDQADSPPQGVAEWVPVLEADFEGIMSFWELPVPTIAAVNGPALAGGFELMLGCDLAIASQDALFGEPELKFGAGIVALLLPWFVGPKVAKYMIYTGEDKLSAAEAQDLGIVNRVVAASDVMPSAIALASKLAQIDPMVLRRTKLAINRGYELMGMRASLRAALDMDILIEGEGSNVKREFLKLVRTKGMAEALAWRERRAEEG